MNMAQNAQRTDRATTPWASFQQRSATRTLHSIARFNLRITLAALLVLCLSIPSVLSASAGRAYADEELQRTAYEIQQQLEEAQAAYGEAREEADRAAERVAEQEERIAEIEEQIPDQQERSSEATRELYKFQKQSNSVIELLLGSDSLASFINQLEYITRITDANYAEIQRLNDLKQQLADERDSLRTTQSEAANRVDEARAAMEAAQEAQAEAQRRIEEDARLQAALAVVQAELSEEPRSNDSADGAGGNSISNGGNSNPGGGASAPPAGADMSGDMASFVAQWAPRIDAYLAGSPMAGQGSTFARAAYTYNVDPRFSPAIACVESGKGAYCFRPHNAWGWGSSSWGSWEEAINAHVRGLSIGYGYTVTPEGARKYCPPNADFWYSTVSSQMNLI